MAYADLDDFMVRLGRSLDTGEENARAQAALDDAAALIDTVTAVPETVPAGVVAINCSVALRVFGNPDQLTSETVGNYSWRVDGAGLYLTSPEEQALRRLSSTSSPSGLWTQGLTRDSIDDPVFALDQYGGDGILLAADCPGDTSIA